MSWKVEAPAGNVPAAHSAWLRSSKGHGRDSRSAFGGSQGFYSTRISVSTATLTRRTTAAKRKDPGCRGTVSGSETHSHILGFMPGVAGGELGTGGTAELD